MAKYNVSVNGNQLVVTLVVSGGDFEPNFRTFRSPSTKLVKQGIKLMESGIYKMKLTFSQINEIGGVIPINLEDASDLIIELIGTGAVTSYNFDLTSPNWSSEGVTDEASFINWLETRSSYDDNDLTNIVVTDFNFEGDRLRCNMMADGTIYDLSEFELEKADKIGVVNGLEYLFIDNNNITNFNPSISLPNTLLELTAESNQIVDFNPTLPLPTSLTFIDLGGNQIVDFNPTIPLPISLINLNLSTNQIVTFNPTISLPSVLELLNLTDNQIAIFNPIISLPISLVSLNLSFNQITTAGYTASEAWATAQPSFTNTCSISFNLNLNLVTGTNLETILLTKNTTITP